MKIIPRMVLFSAIALLLTSYWNRGFVLEFQFWPFLQLSLFVAILHFIIGPIMRLIFLPINIFTFGLVSLLVYFFLFYIATSLVPILTIKEWVFPGINLLIVTLPKFTISQLQNIALSSLSVSYIISLLEKII
jgi:uncharacterized membrane protein YvlD (DUF360 family)